MMTKMELVGTVGRVDDGNAREVPGLILDKDVEMPAPFLQEFMPGSVVRVTVELLLDTEFAKEA